jgi:hypothetical protein
MFKKLILPACLSISLFGCTDLMLPRFDGGVLNPDIRYLRAAEVMQGVKCAMVAFMKEREALLHSRRNSTDPRLRGDLERIEVKKDKTKYLRNALTAPLKAPECEIGRYVKREEFHLGSNACRPNDCKSKSFPRLSDSLWDYEQVWSKEKGILEDKGCTPVPDYSRFALDSTQSASIELTLVGSNLGQVSYTKIDALSLDPRSRLIAPGGGPNNALFPQLSLNGKDTTTLALTASMPQSIHGFQQKGRPFVSSFKVNPPRAAIKKGKVSKKNKLISSSKVRAKIRKPDSIAIMEYNKTDVIKKLENYKLPEKVKEKIAGLESTKPQVDDKNLALSEQARIAQQNVHAVTNSKDIIDKTAELHRELVKLDQDETKTAEKLVRAYREVSEKLSDLGPQPKKVQAVEAQTDLNKVVAEIEVARQQAKTPEIKAEAEKLRNETQRAQKEIVKAAADSPLSAGASAGGQNDETNHFAQGCGITASIAEVDSTTRIDYLGLKNILNNIVEEQNREDRIYSGIPEVSLDSLVLTSAFQVVLDTSAGMSHLFHFIPIVIPPVAQLKVDHTHTLKITLRGPKNKKDPGAAKKLADSCRQRIADNSRSTGSDAEATAVCDTAQGKLIESLIQAVQQINSGSGSSQ